jgi:hypothetical protein
MTEGLKLVLSKMCTYIDIPFDDIDFEQRDWYLQHEWTEENQNDFVDWLTNQLQNNSKIRKDLTTMNHKPNEEYARTSAGWFILYCGWKTKKNND